LRNKFYARKFRILGKEAADRKTEIVEMKEEE
jgi:hypothetical protein